MVRSWLMSRLSSLNAAGYRIVGGHMVTMLVARWQLGATLYRETGPAPTAAARATGL